MRIKNGAGAVILVMTVLATLVAPTGVRAHIEPYVFSSFDFPGADVTQAYGINDGVVITFDVPGSARTTPQDINAAVSSLERTGIPASLLPSCTHSC